MSTVNNFRVGDEVVWTSQSSGYEKEKRGTVLHVVPANAHLPVEATRELQGHGGPRKHTSYVVFVRAKTSTGKGRWYWPNTSALRKAA